MSRSYRQNPDRRPDEPNRPAAKGASLVDALSSAYVEAANTLAGPRVRRKVVAYVESYDDIYFWSRLLRPLEDERTCFEVMLPSRTGLAKGKKIALARTLGPRLGDCMIACVDADYDYLLDGVGENAARMKDNPYVFHTYVYAIESFQCYAPALAEVAVGATLNDRREFDFEAFMAEYSRTVWPLFAWSVWAYRYGRYQRFSLADFARVSGMPGIDHRRAAAELEALRRRVNVQIGKLHRLFPEGRKSYKPLCRQLEALGVRPEEAYLYMRGHDLLDNVVGPLMESVCRVLRREREREIQTRACHATQMQNELSAYRHAVAAPADLLRKHTAYATSDAYRRIVADIRRFLAERTENRNNNPVK